MLYDSGPCSCFIEIYTGWARAPVTLVCCENVRVWSCMLLFGCQRSGSTDKTRYNDPAGKFQCSNDLPVWHRRLHSNRCCYETHRGQLLDFSVIMLGTYDKWPNISTSETGTRNVTPSSVSFKNPFYNIFYRTFVKGFLQTRKTYRSIQGGPKKPDHFWTLITLQWLAVERGVICQKFANFV